MNCSRAFVVLAWACAFCQVTAGTVRAQLLADPVAITEKQAEKGSELFLNYVQNRDEVKRYACAIHVDTTVEGIRDPASSFHKSVWYFHSADVDKKISRQDELVWTDTISRRGLGEKEFPLITFFSGRNVIQVRNSKSISGADIEDADEASYRNFSSQAITVPWELPILGCPQIHVSLASKSLFARYDVVNVVRQSAKPEAFDQILDKIAVKYRLRAPNRSTEDSAMRIVFDESKGNMPIECDYLADNGNLRQMETKWSKWNNHWFPTEVSMELLLGPVGKRTTIYHDKYRIYWVLEEAVSDQVFETQAPGIVTSAELRDAIMEFAINQR